VNPIALDGGLGSLVVRERRLGWDLASLVRCGSGFAQCKAGDEPRPGPVDGHPAVASSRMSADGGAFDLDLAVSSLASDSGDTQLMMRLLTERLADVLGNRLRVVRQGGLLRRSNLIQRVEIQIAESELVADLHGATSTFIIGRVSGGIRIRNERTDAAGWLRTLLEALRLEAEHSATTRQALEAMVIGGN
jgi:hypothetical protein